MTPESFHFAGGSTEDLPAIFSDSCAMDLSLRDCNLRGGRINLGEPSDYWVKPPAYQATATGNWFNNLFDRVNINLDPDRIHQGDSTLYVDLGFQAYNNLFRSGRLRLVPIPATAGTWVLKDNLFDKEEFGNTFGPSLSIRVSRWLRDRTFRTLA